MGIREKAKKKAEKDMNRGGNYKLNIPEGTQKFVPKGKGPYHLDVIPYKVTVDNHPEVAKGELWFQRTYWVHFGLGESGKQSAVCPKTFKKACPVCEYYKELANSDDEDDREQAKAIKPKERELYNVIDLDDQDAGVKLFEYSWHLFGKALSEEVNEGTEEEAGFPELEGGKTLKVSFKKQQLGSNPYYEARRIDFEDREDYDEDILEDTLDLDNIINVPSYKELEALLHGVESDTEEEGEEEEEEEEKPSKKKGSKSSSKKSSSKKKSSDEDEDEGEEEEKPKKGKKSSTKKSSTKKGKKSSDEDKDEKPSKTAGKVSKKKGKKKTKCPGGGEYGEDIDNLDECEDCDIYAECMESYEANHDDDD